MRWLRAGGRGATVARERLRVRNALVGSQVALAVVLLVGSGLLVRSHRALAAIDPGFAVDDITTFGLVLPATRYTNESASQLYHRLADRLRALPGVEDAAVTTGLPVTPYGASYRVEIEGEDASDIFAVRWVTPGYFEAMGIPVLHGRTMLPEDGEAFKFFISKSFSDTYWPGSSGVGGRVGPPGYLTEVVGVVADVRLRGLDTPPEAVAYVPFGGPSPTVLSASVVVRSALSADELRGLVLSEVDAIDPQLPVLDFKSMRDVVAQSLAVSRIRFTMLLLVSAALVALLLGAVGVYGVLAYVVARRTPEIGVRMALGAQSYDILPVLGRCLLPVVVGIGIGVATAAIGSQVLESVLFATTPLDAATFLVAPSTFVAAALLACIAPTVRALRISPLEALRAD